MTVRGLRIICGSLVGGLVFFAAVSIAFIAMGTFTESPLLPAGLLPIVWLGTLPMAFGARPVTERLSEPRAGEDPDDFAQRWTSAVIIGMALREGTGLLGVVLSLAAASMTWTAVFAATGVAFMVFEWPQKDGPAERLRRAELREGLNP